MLDGQFDDRLPESELVLGICHSSEVVAFSLSEIHRQGCLIHETLGDDPVVVWSRSPASAWMAAFHRNVDGTTLEFEFADGGFRDLQTGTLWSVEGRAVEGPQTGKALKPLDFVSVKWNAWSGFHPHTKVYRSESPSRVNIDHSDFQPLFDSLDNAGFPVEVEKEWMQSSLPPGARHGLDVRVAGDSFRAFLFESAGAANDYTSSRLLIPKDLYISFFVGEAPSDLVRHAAASGPFVLESNPEVQYSDPESLKRLPEEDIKWSPLLDDPAFQNALRDLAASPAYAGETQEGSFGALFATIGGDGYEVRQIKPMLRKWLRPKAVSGYSAVIAGDRFLVYQFDSPAGAAAYQAERHHTVRAGAFVFRSDPPDQYHMATEQTIDRPVEQIHWSTLLEDAQFLQTLGKVG
jgi:hypothetical protein